MKDMETSQMSVNSLVDAVSAVGVGLVGGVCHPSLLPHVQEKRKVRKALDQQRRAEAQLGVEAER